MNIYLWILVFLVSLVVLLKSSDFFIDYSKILGRIFGLSDVLIGITIVAIGTSLPEMVTSIIANIQGQSEIVVSDVVGSDIANIMLVFGIGIIILKKIEIHKSLFIDAIILMFTTLLLLFLSLDYKIELFESVIFVILFLLYLYYLIKTKRNTEKTEKVVNNEHSIIKILAILSVSGFGIYISSDFVVKAVVEISIITGIGKDVITATAVAFGTSLPELVVSVISAKKSEHDIMVGNVIGSNMFNILSVVGISGLIGTLTVTPTLMNLAFPILIGATVYLVVATMKRKAIFYEGIILVAGYVLFYLKLFNVI